MANTAVQGEDPHPGFDPPGITEAIWAAESDISTIINYQEYLNPTIEVISVS